MNGQIEYLIGGYKFAIAVVRKNNQSVKLRIFDNSEPLTNFKDI